MVRCQLKHNSFCLWQLKKLEQYVLWCQDQAYSEVIEYNVGQVAVRCIICTKDVQIVITFTECCFPSVWLKQILFSFALMLQLRIIEDGKVFTLSFVEQKHGLLLGWKETGNSRQQHAQKLKIKCKRFYKLKNLHGLSNRRLRRYHPIRQGSLTIHLYLPLCPRKGLRVAARV